MFVAPRAGQARRKLRTNFPSMTVTELVEYAAMLVEEAMVSVLSRKELSPGTSTFL